MGVAFTGAANFTGINPGGRIFINLVQHDAFVEVNETGTEAAAATIVGFARTSAPQYQVRPFVFRADRPFFYFIVDNERKIPLLMGTLYKP
jgi:serpin B